MPELQLRFRDTMARVPAPVTIVTTMLDGAPFGTTVSAFASLSLTPPMVMFALDNRGSMKDRIAQAGQAGINILAGDQAELARRFASPVDRFEGVEWEIHDDVPRLAGVAGFVHCGTVDLLPGGDHTVVVGTVDDACPVAEESLSYHLRTFHSVPARRR